jgi:hypothetical protein
VISRHPSSSDVARPTSPADSAEQITLNKRVVVEQDLGLATPQLADGLCLELNYYDGVGSYVQEGIYELTAWGVFRGLPEPPRTPRAAS